MRQVALDTLTGRVREAVRTVGTYKEVGALVGVNVGTLVAYLKGANRIPIPFLARLSLHSGYRLQWLLTGVGDSYHQVRWGTGIPSRANSLEVHQMVATSPTAMVILYNLETGGRI